MCFVTAGDFVCLYGNFVCMFEDSLSLNNVLFILLYMSFYLHCSYKLHFLVVMLNQTTVVKTLPIVPDIQFHNSLPVISQSVSHSRGQFSNTYHYICHT